VYRADWLLENLLVFVAVPAFVLTRRRMRFSNAAYACLAAFFALHAVGAHYTYSIVPYDAWFEQLTGRGLNETLGWSRNHYDRFVHFAYGALLLLPASELLDRVAPPRGWWRFFLPVLFIASHSVVYELIEFAAAIVFGGDLGQAYLGSQGDEWDYKRIRCHDERAVVWRWCWRAARTGLSRRRIGMADMSCRAGARARCSTRCQVAAHHAAAPRARPDGAVRRRRRRRDPIRRPVVSARSRQAPGHLSSSRAQANGAGSAAVNLLGDDLGLETAGWLHQSPTTRSAPRARATRKRREQAVGGSTHSCVAKYWIS
jgi:putative membrane protein